MKNDKFRQFLTILALTTTLVVNGLANALPLNGQTTGAISDRFRVYFVPAGYVFSIWGLIYLALIGFAVWQALPAQRENPQLRRIGTLFLASCLLNASWIFLWHYNYFVLTVVVMTALLLSLIAIYLRLETGKEKASTGMFWFLKVPFSLYLGWITVATIANATIVLAYLRWDGWGISPQIWAVIMLAAATVIAGAVSVTRGDVPFMLVIIWAFAGIAVKQSSALVVSTAAWISA